MKQLKTVLPYLIGAAVFFLFAAILLKGRSADYLEKGRAAESKGDLVEAIEMYEWSIQNYTPILNHTREAIGRLEAIAAKAEQEGATDTALQAWQGVVSGLAVIRHFRQPFPEEKARADEALDRLRERVIAKRTTGAG